jgi:PAS domain S-box-containing protein
MSDPAREIFSSIVNQMAEGVLYLDADDTILICNPAAELIRKVKAERIVGKSVFDIHPMVAHESIRELLSALKTGTVASRNRKIEAQGRYFDNSYSAIWGADGTYQGTLLISRDISESKRLNEENLELKAVITRDGDDPFIAESAAMKRVIEMVQTVAPLDSTVLLTGESGTGKERLVDLLHRLGDRRKGPMVKVNCAALPENLLESELFGHTRGAFTGAIADQRGKFELAHGGTLFLDEIGELPLASQAKLLRAIQEKRVQPLGAKNDVECDVRIVAATNRDLVEKVAAGEFREDLFYRFNVIKIDVPPLRQRVEDIMPLARVFAEKFAATMGKRKMKIAPAVRDLLLSHPLPGNVRQLKHAIERAVALGQGREVTLADLPPEMLTEGCAASGGDTGCRLRDAVGNFERGYIAQVLSRHGGHRSRAAKHLGISRKSLWEKLTRYGLSDEV